jgi:hypothetical protein
MPTPVPPPAVTEEPTLHALVLRFVHEKTPHQFYLAIQLAFPWAIYFGTIDWWRAAGLATAVGCFGLWALADRWLREEDRVGSVAGRVVRAGSALVSGGLTVALILERFVHMMPPGPKS